MIRMVSFQTSLLFFWKRYSALGTNGSRESNRTFEKVGAAVFLYLFHSSPSEATIFEPNTVTQ